MFVVLCQAHCRAPTQTPPTLLCDRIVPAFRWKYLKYVQINHYNMIKGYDELAFHFSLKAQSIHSQGAFPCAPGDEVCALDYKTSGCSGRKRRSPHGGHTHPPCIPRPGFPCPGHQHQHGKRSAQQQQEAAFPGNAHPEPFHHGPVGAHPEAGAHPSAFAHQPNLAHPQAAAFPGTAF